MRRQEKLAAGWVVFCLAAGCAAATDARSVGDPRTSAVVSGTATGAWETGDRPAAALPADDPYLGLARQLNARGVEVWFESDLVARWLEGPTAFRTAVNRLRLLGSMPGVRGFKVADELGYHDGIDSPAEATRFLHAVREALVRDDPGKEILIDVMVPELGCLAWAPVGSTACATRARRVSPAATLNSVSGYLVLGLVDRLNLSTGLLDAATYRSWGTEIVDAQAAAWARVGEFGWGGLTVLQSRKALAAVDGYQGSPADATRDGHLYVAVPRAAGAQAVDIWTWRQQYDGGTVSLFGARPTENPLWPVLGSLRGNGARLFTHMTPSLLPAAPSPRVREYVLVAAAFDAVFVAAGTG